MCHIPQATLPTKPQASPLYRAWCEWNIVNLASSLGFGGDGTGEMEQNEWATLREKNPA